MKKINSLIIIVFIFLSCSSKIKHLPEIDIIDRTEELTNRKGEWIELAANERIDGYTRIGNLIFGGDIFSDANPLKADAKTFKVCIGTDYAKDKKQVYYPIIITCVDYADKIGGCYYSEIIVKKANPSTFRYLEKEYATDGKRAYFRGNRINNADGSTFRVINGPKYFYFAVDKKNVYKHDKIFEDADPFTFCYIRNISEDIYLIGDKNKKWEYQPPDSIREIIMSHVMENPLLGVTCK